MILTTRISIWILPLIMCSVITVNTSTSNEHTKTRMLFYSNVRFILLSKNANSINICHISCFNQNNQNMILNKSITASGIFEFGTVLTRLVNENDQTDCNSLSEVVHTTDGDSWIKVDAGQDINVVKCTILNRVSSTDNEVSTRLNGAKLSLLDVNNNELAFRTITTAAPGAENRFVTLNFTSPIIAQLLYFKYYPKLITTTDYYMIQINKSTAQNGLTELTPILQGTIKNDDFRYALEVYKNDNNSYSFNYKYAFDMSENLVYKKFLPDFENKFIKDASGVYYFYVIWIEDGNLNNFVSCTGSEFKSRFNIKLFSCANAANHFFENINLFIKQGIVINEKHLFDANGENIKSYSTQSSCQTTIKDCLINGMCAC